MTDTVICLSENADAADLAEALVDNNVRAAPTCASALATSRPIGAGREYLVLQVVRP